MILWSLSWNFSNFGYVFVSEVRVCVPGLILVGARQEETGGDFLIDRDWDKTTYPMSHSSGNFGKGWDYSVPTQEKSWKILKWAKILGGLESLWLRFDRKWVLYVCMYVCILLVLYPSRQKSFWSMICLVSVSTRKSAFNNF